MYIFWIPAYTEEDVAVKSNGNNMFLFKGTASLIKRPANLSNKAPGNSPDWIISDISVLLSLTSVDIL